MRFSQSVLAVCVAVLFGFGEARAQPLGAFTWQLQPFCNALTFNVTQLGSIFTLDGFDDQCGAPTRAAATGAAFSNPDGTIGLGIALVVTPGAAPVHVDATISLATLSGGWRDSAGHSGTFAFGASIGGSPRPTLSGVSGVQFNIGDQAVLRASGPESVQVGLGAGGSSTAADNTFVGAGAGGGNTTGSSNTFIGSNAGGGATVVNATAIGANAFVQTSDALVLGSIAGLNGATTTARVGIGTSTPQANLDLTHGPGLTNIRIFGAPDVPNIIGVAANGSLAATTGVLEGFTLLRLDGSGHDSIGLTASRARINLDAAEDWTTMANGTRIRFYTTATGATFQQLRLTIEPDGRVGIGTQTPQDALHVSGEARVTSCVRNGGGGTIAGMCASDERLKRDVLALASALGDVARLRPVEFSWRADEFPARGFGNQRELGLLAQEVEQVLPALVSTDAEGLKAVNYSALPILAIQAIKELKEKNDALAQRLAALEAALYERR